MATHSFAAADAFRPGEFNVNVVKGNSAQVAGIFRNKAQKVCLDQSIRTNFFVLRSSLVCHLFGAFY